MYYCLPVVVVVVSRLENTPCYVIVWSISVKISKNKQVARMQNIVSNIHLQAQMLRQSQDLVKSSLLQRSVGSSEYSGKQYSS
jgi:hypothetical protein